MLTRRDRPTRLLPAAFISEIVNQTIVKDTLIAHDYFLESGIGEYRTRPGYRA